MVEKTSRHIISHWRETFTKPRLSRETRSKYNNLFGKDHNPFFAGQLKYLEYDSLEALNEVVLPFLIHLKTDSLIGDESMSYFFDEFYNKKSSSITDLTLDFIKGVFKTSDHPDINDNQQDLFKQWVEVCSAVDVTKSIKQKDVLASNHVFTADDGSLLVVKEKTDEEFPYKKDAVLVDFGEKKLKIDIIIDQTIQQDETMPLGVNNILKKDFSLPISFFDEYFNFPEDGTPKKPRAFYVSEFSKDQINSPIYYIVLNGVPNNMSLMDKGFIIGNSCFSFLTSYTTARLLIKGQLANTLQSKKAIAAKEKLYSQNLEKYPSVPNKPYQLTQFI